MKRAQAFLGTVAVLLAGGAAAAEPLPVPGVDYSIKGTMAGGLAIHYRHGNGKMRMEMKSPDMPQPMTAYFDVRTRKGVMVMNLPGMPPMAIETGMDEDGSPPIPHGKGRRIGSDRVAGEPCEDWQIDPETPEEKETASVVCITHDGITLRMIGNIDGKRQTILLVTEVSRGPQDPKQLVPPPGLKPMQMPAGMPTRK